MSGPASRKIAALMQFGLLDRAGNTYVVSALAEGRTIEVCVPGSQIKVVFPEEYAFELSIGRFGAGIEALRKSADELRHEIDNRQKEVK